MVGAAMSRDIGELRTLADGRDGEEVGEPAAQQINLNQRGAAVGAERARIGPRRGPGVVVGGHRIYGEQVQEDSTDESDNESQASQHSRHHNCRRPAADNLGNLKLRIPPFHGKNDPDANLEWEKKIELVFNCQQFTEERNVRLAATEFYGYAINWWEQIATTSRCNGEPQIAFWFEMKTVMNKRFVPTHYGRDLQQKLRRLSQGAKSVEDYHQEMETLILKADLIEGAEATMARFQGGLNRDIRDRLELQEYEDMDELLHKAILIEQQNKRKSSAKTPNGSAAKSVYSKDDKSSDKPKEGSSLVEARRDDKGKESATSTRSRNVRCFKCHGIGHYANDCTNKKVMIILANGDVVSEDEKSDQESEDEGVEYPVRGELLVTRRLLNAQPKAKEDEQRENICTNVASEELVDKLDLEVYKHPKPYLLQWFNEEGGLKISKQVKVLLSVGRYQDEITCDVAPLEASHILLGRPWLFDKRAVHDGFTNRHTFTHKEKQITLVPLSPQEVHQDHMHLKKRRDEDKVTGKALLLDESKQEYRDVFPEDNLVGLPPIRGIEHQIDFVPGASIPNRPAYMTNPVETKELQKQVNELLEKGHIRESLSPCVVHVLLVPKKDATGQTLLRQRSSRNKSMNSWRKATSGKA
ncbi:PREDICTED: uncharacterized protein LOC106344799 [Brassica oleracea var. oleracea]|uniref:uncharacterized protein LOC106344799 n=1 Tax=Brassica oleracea var. oleracea TaxID=109376 RepID=UPI0006A6F700|nr:PREDICTED: uncharacterized protein LOC106344799 [Brassica oleracea var. oleracea]